MAAYEILRVALDAISWTAITASVEMDSFSVRCDSGTMRIRTTDTDANTEDSIAAGAQEVVNAPVRHTRGDFPRFRQGDVLCYLRMSSGTGTVIVRSVESTLRIP